MISRYCCTTILWCQYSRPIFHIKLYSLIFLRMSWGKFDKSHLKTLKIIGGRLPFARAHRDFYFSLNVL